jgi:hypothetical protein
VCSSDLVEDEYLPYLKQFPLPPAPGYGGA